MCEFEPVFLFSKAHQPAHFQVNDGRPLTFHTLPLSMHRELSETQERKIGATESGVVNKHELTVHPETNDQPQNDKKGETDIARLVSIVEIVKREFLSTRDDGHGLYQYNELGSLDLLQGHSHAEATVSSFTKPL